MTRRRKEPANDEEWEALLRDTAHLPVIKHPPLYLSRDGIYGADFTRYGVTVLDPAAPRG